MSLQHALRHLHRLLTEWHPAHLETYRGNPSRETGQDIRGWIDQRVAEDRLTLVSRSSLHCMTPGELPEAPVLHRSIAQAVIALLCKYSDSHPTH